MFFKTGDKVWATIPNKGEVPDVVVERNGTCIASACEEHPETRAYWLENLTLLCGSMLRPRGEDDDLQIERVESQEDVSLA